jgi:hypothetical protein
MIKVSIAHVQPHYNRLIEVFAVTPGEPLLPHAAPLVTLTSGQQLLVREVPER